MVVYSLTHPTEETRKEIGYDNIEGGRILVEKFLRSRGVSDAIVYVSNVGEIQLKSEKPLPAPILAELSSSICEIKEA